MLFIRFAFAKMGIEKRMKNKGKGKGKGKAADKRESATSTASSPAPKASRSSTHQPQKGIVVADITSTDSALQMLAATQYRPPNASASLESSRKRMREEGPAQSSQKSNKKRKKSKGNQIRRLHSALVSLCFLCSRWHLQLIHTSYYSERLCDSTKLSSSFFLFSEEESKPSQSGWSWRPYSKEDWVLLVGEVNNLTKIFFLEDIKHFPTPLFPTLLIL